MTKRGDTLVTEIFEIKYFQNFMDREFTNINMLQLLGLKPAFTNSQYKENLLHKQSVYFVKVPVKVWILPQVIS